jgi:hypothetical protein
MVLKGSSALYSQLYDEFEDKKPEGGWNKHDRHDHTPEQIQWLIDHGCEYHKVTADPGDLLLWDSVSTFMHLSMGSRLMSIADRTLRSHPKLDESPNSEL